MKRELEFKWNDKTIIFCEPDEDGYIFIEIETSGDTIETLYINSKNIIELRDFLNKHIE